MIDALELTIPKGAAFKPRWNVLRTAQFPDGLVTAAHHTIDLRPFGLSAFLQRRYRRTTIHEKLGLRNASALSYSQMRSIVMELLDCDAAPLRVARIDFAVDTPGSLVDLFHRSIFAPKKTSFSLYARRNRLGTVRVESIYVGRRPNCVRIYLRVGTVEGGNRGRQVCEVTRVERQCAGSGVPELLRTFEQIKNAHEYDPFFELKAIFTDTPLPANKPITLIKLLARKGFSEFIKELGAQQANCLANRYSMGNAARVRRMLGIEQRPIATVFPDLTERFRTSIRRQLDVDGVLGDIGVQAVQGFDNVDHTEHRQMSNSTQNALPGSTAVVMD